ncbi:AI-2E family transporter [Rubellimicrobium aerolatum]|uniref:AI-2E family transporter n=1 Tax=Rubellimicrobium aerolatum TaxID=490979 RepID=A0ABW0SAY8_9RHOB|nr:AI-2E family transporter [Rubellimicrobium aerolatum]MBP1805395.1 putative PurR-regulated permease PerM [Rubellimicrobium aerolatum]
MAEVVEDDIEEQQLEVAEDSNVELRRIRRYLMFSFLLALFTAVYFARDVLLPIVLAVVLTLTLLPVVRAGERIRIPPGLTSVALMVVLALLLFLAGYFLSGPIQGIVADAPRMAEEIQQRASGLLSRWRDLTEQAGQVTGGAAGAATDAGTLIDTNGDGVATTRVVAVVENGEGSGGFVGYIVSSVASAGGAVGAALVLTAFLLASGDFYHRRIVEAAPRLRDKKKTLTIIRDVERQISRYLGSITLINLGLGVAIGAATWALGMPMAVLWGVLGFLLNYIPFVGNILTVALVGAVALVTYDSLWAALLPPLAVVGLSALESQVVTPVVVGRRLELNQVSQLIMVAFWTWLWGVPGAILAVPFLVVVKAVCDNVESLQKLGAFLAGDPSTKADEAPQKATTGPALESAPFRTQAEAREDSPPTQAPGDTRVTPLLAE